MSPGYKLTPAADRDIVEIWHYTCEMWGREQANRYLGRIEKSLIDLVAQPSLGKPRDEIRTGYRSFQTDHHLIFYRQNFQKQIEVVRILHERMDYKIHF